MPVLGAAWLDSLDEGASRDRQTWSSPGRAVTISVPLVGECYLLGDPSVTEAANLLTHTAKLHLRGVRDTPANPYTNAPNPVMARPTTSALISRVPSYE